MRLGKKIIAVLSLLMLVASCSDDLGKNEPVALPDILGTGSEKAITTVKMMLEFDAYLKNSSAYPLSEVKINRMFTNTGKPFSDKDLNASGISLKEMAAVTAKEQLDDFFDEMSKISLAYLSPAAKGIKGSYGGTKSVRVFNEKGIEMQQVIVKSMMGAVLLNRTLKLCINKAALNTVATNGEKAKKWDEGYNYIFGYQGPDQNKRYFWQSYLNTIDGNSHFTGITEKVLKAFTDGREAILSGRIVTTEKQIQIIQENLSKVGAIRAVYYMNKAKKKLSNVVRITEDQASAFHTLSEAYGFIFGLAYTYNPETRMPYISKSEVDTILETLAGGEDGFWDADYTRKQIDIVSEKIAKAFGFKVAQAIAEGGSH